jgi:hypothetical protein
MNNSALTLSLISFLLFANLANGQWLQMNFPGTQTADAFAVKGSSIFAGTSGSGIFLSVDSGSSWSAVNAGLTYKNVRSLAVSGDNIFAGTDSGVFLSTNNGALWTLVNNGLMTTSVRSLAVSGGNIFTGTDSGLFLSANNGALWTSINIGQTYSKIYSLAINNSNIFAGTWGGGVSVSTNGGISWTSNTSASMANTGVYALAVSGNNIFAGTYNGILGGGIFLSTDNSTTWTPVNNSYPYNGLAGSTVLALAVVSGGFIFASNYGVGAWLTKDNGGLWEGVNTGLPAELQGMYGKGLYGIFAFAVSNGYIFAGTDKWGIWRRPLSEMVSILPQHQQSLPLRTKLHITSGTLHSSVILIYSIQSRGVIHLGLFTISGKRVAEVDQGEKTPGEHTVRFDSEAIPAGLYVCRFRAESYQESNRIVLIK